MEVQDYRNDVILAATCREDVEKYCASVGGGWMEVGLSVGGWRGRAGRVGGRVARRADRVSLSCSGGWTL